MTYGTDPHYWQYETTGVLRPAVEEALLIGGFCGLIIGYAIGTLMWFRPTNRASGKQADV